MLMLSCYLTGYLLIILRRDMMINLLFFFFSINQCVLKGLRLSVKGGDEGRVWREQVKGWNGERE